MLQSTLYWAPDGTLVALRSERPQHGPIFYVSAVVAWTYVCAGLWHSALAALRIGWRRPARTALLVLAIVLPLGLNMLHAFGIIGPTDPSPALFGPSALMIRFGVVDPGLARHLPLARTDIIEQLAVGVVVADIHGFVIDANASARRLLGVEKPRGRPFDTLCEGVGPAVEVLRLPLRSHLAMTGAAAVLTDRPQAVETERRLQLAGRLQAVGSLTAGMAHESNNPLAYIRSNLNLLEKLVSELVSPGVSARLPDRLKHLAIDAADCVIDTKDGIECIALLVTRLEDSARETLPASGCEALVDLGEAARRGRPGSPGVARATAPCSACISRCVRVRSRSRAQPAASPIHEDRRRPGALLDGARAVVVQWDVPARDRIGVDRRARVLDRTHVVDRIAALAREIGVGEGDPAAGGIGLAEEHPPGVVDQHRHLLHAIETRADLHDLDPVDEPSLVRRVVALAPAQPVEGGRVESRGRVVGAARLLLE